MNFKGLQIYGFKSFADRTDVKFEGGFTGIVGPNGCGKSNVSDSIKWVLGEQSSKALRGTSMQDVIFNGTDKRGSLSFCEVTLVFDNSNRMFNVNFDEVAITRKLFRSGESDYQINHTPCRLKDITDMLSDTGLGKNGLSIIGQGKIDDIVSAKPDDRRKVFEEAAGIARLKKKKRESELKLSRVRLNLERINYILTELERQLEPLKKQAEDAKIYLELTKELKYNEINYYLFKYENSSAVIRDINLKIESLKDEHERLTTALEKANDEYNSNMTETSKSDEQLEILQGRLTKLLVNSEKLAGEGKVLYERMNNDKKSLKNLLKRNEKLEKEIEEKTALLKDNNQELESSLREKDNLEVELEEVSDKYLNLVEEILDDETRLEKSNLNIFNSLDKLSDIKAEISKLKTEKDSLENQIKEIDEESASSKEKVENAEKERDILVAKLEQIETDSDNKNAEIVKLRNLYNEKRFKINELSQKIIEANSKKSAIETKNKLLESMKNSYDNFHLSVKRIMQDARRDKTLGACIEGVVAELVKVPRRYTLAIETVLGGALQNIVTQTQKDAAYVIAYLKKNRYGRITFLPMDSYSVKPLAEIYRTVLKEKGVVGIASDLVKFNKKYKSIFEGLLGRTVVVKTIKEAISISQRYRNAFRLVTLEGEVFSTNGSMAGGSKKQGKADILSRDDEIETNEKLLEEIVALCTKLQNEQKKLGEELESILDKINDVDEAIQSFEVNYATIEQKIEQAEKIIDDTSVNLNLRESKITSLKNRIKDIVLQKEMIEKLANEAEFEKSSADKLIAESKSMFDEKKSTRDKLGERQNEIKVKMAELEHSTKTLYSDIERYKREVKVAEQTINQNLEKEKTLKSKIDNTGLEIQKIALANAENEEIDKLRIEIDKLTKFKKELQDAILDLDIKRGDLNSDINRLASEKIREENKLNKLDNELRNLQQNIEETYDLTYETALEFKDENYAFTNNQAVITKCKRKISALGSVNVNSIDDYAEIGERYEDLNSQRNDLSEAEVDLEKIIDDLTNEMVLKFKTEFNKINENFKVVFKELFNGGRAQLILEENEDDPLEAGIKIEAEPPGKKMGSISLLSGGERALIAIGILFAILKVKPMPFCLLDEIEAALDDSNVKVFASYLRKFSQDTQFIVITHRKPTMELADSLYGVTMQEKGVSKMVSVKLSEAMKNVKIINDKKKAEA